MVDRDGLNQAELIQLDSLLSVITTLNDAQLAQLYHNAGAAIEEHEKRLHQSLSYVTAQAAREEVTRILTARLEATGARSITTPYGTIHTVGKTTARIMDPVAFQGFVIEQRAWGMIDWHANMSACRAFMEEESMPVPGVELSTHRHLRITAPKKGTENVE